MQFAIGQIKINQLMYGTPRLARIEVDGKPVDFNLGNYEQWQDLIDETDCGVFRFYPQDQFAFFIPMAEVSIMLMQGFEAQRIRREFTAEVMAEAKKLESAAIVVDATA
jgi:hypothetical protein